MSELIDTTIDTVIAESEGEEGFGVQNMARVALRPNTIRDVALDLVKSQTPKEGSGYPEEPEEFYKKVFGMELAPFQVSMLDTILNNKYTAVTTCTSIGKTMTLSRFVLYWLHTHPNSIVITTGPSGRQVRYVMWGNVRTAAEEARMDLLGEAMVDRYEIGPMWYGYGFKASKENIAGMQGFHADNFLVIVDEATGVPNDIVDVMRNTMVHPGARFVMLSNPVSTAGRLYEAFHGDADAWATIQLGFQDTPNFPYAPPEFLEKVNAYLKGNASFPLDEAKTINWNDYPFPKKWEGMINWPFVLDQIYLFGEDSAFVQSRIWGRFVSEEDVLIPLALIDRAKSWDREEVVATSPYEAGLDVGRFGADKSVLVVRKGPRVVGIYDWKHKTTTETARRALNTLADYHPETQKIKIDEIGVGGGVVDYMKEQARSGSSNLRVVGVNVSEKSSNKERWRNQRQEGFNHLAGLFRRGHIAIGPDEQLAWGEFGFSWPVEADVELSDLRYSFDDHTEPVVESKDKFRERRGRSPDYADALMLAFFNPKAPRDDTKTGIISQGSANIYRKAGTSWRRRRR